MFDPEEAQQLETTVSSEKAHVQRCKEKVDELSSHLPGIDHHSRGPAAPMHVADTTINVR